jgi:palmitoyltransferase ZDHHC4
MIRTAFKKLKRSPTTMYLYLFLMSFAFFCLANSAYYLLYIRGLHAWLYTSYSLFAIAVALCFSVYFSDPGYLQQKKVFDLVALLNEYEPSSVCPDCESLRTPRSRHCNLCGRCVDRFDHHCPWVNNCIGRTNFRQFYAFLIVQAMYLATAFVSCIMYFWFEISGSDE